MMKKNVLKLTPLSKPVLYENKKVDLVRPKVAVSRAEKAKAQARVKPKRERIRDELFEILRVLRREIAMQKGVRMQTSLQLHTSERRQKPQIYL